MRPVHMRKSMKCTISTTSMKGIKTCPYSFFKAAKKNNKEQTKFQFKLARKRCQNRQANFWHSKYI